jgi:hypothetical protein
MKKVDDYLHGACATLTFAIAFRPLLLKKTPAELETRFAAIPDPAMRERQRQAVVLGLEAPDGLLALQNYKRFVGEMDACHVLSSNAQCPSLHLRFVNGFAVFENGA